MWNRTPCSPLKENDVPRERPTFLVEEQQTTRRYIPEERAFDRQLLRNVRAVSSSLTNSTPVHAWAATAEAVETVRESFRPIPSIRAVKLLDCSSLFRRLLHDTLIAYRGQRSFISYRDRTKYTEQFKSSKRLKCHIMIGSLYKGILVKEC
jgi:hypothetical protein